MFKKFASNILTDLSDECIVKALLSQNSEDSELYNKIALKINNIVKSLDSTKN
jgi:hypothetical protein